MNKVLYGGAFDIFHWMHLESIRQAKSKGDYLVVAVNTDRLIGEYKNGKVPMFNQEERADIIRSLKFVDEVVFKDTFSDLDLIKQHEINTLVICDEWLDTKKEEQIYLESIGGKVLTIPYLRSSMMPDIKAKFNELMETKGKVLCENCHRLM